jgi:hypothetical protein
MLGCLAGRTMVEWGKGKEWTGQEAKGLPLTLKRYWNLHPAFNQCFLLLGFFSSTDFSSPKQRSHFSLA